MTDPRSVFSHFYDNTVAQTLGSQPRWTISGQIGEDTDDGPATRKAPIDIRHLLDVGRLRGAWAPDERCLVTLDEITERIPLAANLAYRLQAASDGFVVIDIESTCPPEIADRILALGDDEILYRELSMSGNGYHLVAPLPVNFYDFPDAAGKVVLREEHGWYEILIEHYATFTRRPIPAARLQQATSSADAFTTVAELYAHLAAHAKPSAGVTGTAIDISDEMPDIPYAKVLLQKTHSMAEKRLKTLDDFDGDHSRWEFSTLSILYRHLQGAIFNTQSYPGSPKYSESDEAWLLYLLATDILPFRNKHATSRNGRPFLMDRAASLIAMTKADRKAKAAQEKPEPRQRSGF